MWNKFSSKETIAVVIVIIIIIVVFFATKTIKENLDCNKNPGDKCVRGRDTCCPDASGNPYKCFQNYCVPDTSITSTSVSKPQQINIQDNDLVYKPIDMQPEQPQQETKTGAPNGAVCNFGSECASHICNFNTCVDNAYIYNTQTNDDIY